MCDIRITHTILRSKTTFKNLDFVLEKLTSADSAVIPRNFFSPPRETICTLKTY